MLVHESVLQPRKPNGIPPNSMRMGFLDYLRDLRQESFPFTQANKLRIVGVEDVLLAAADSARDSMSYLHRIMSARAGELEKAGGFVQLVFRRKLVRADDFWLEDGMNRLSLRRLFDSPELAADRFGNEFFTVGFNLT
jgi:hypothetical protein